LSYWSDYKALPVAGTLYALMSDHLPRVRWQWQAPNRQIRRLIEKENEKAREAERRKYNDEVRVWLTCDGRMDR
jgi:hypothetical protein